MFKLNFTLLTLLLTAIWLTGISKSASTNSSSQPRITPNSQLLAAEIKKLSSWEDLLDPDPPVEKSSGGSRGGDFCAIAPAVAAYTRTIWSDRPWFIWQGRVSRIDLRLHDSDEVLWSQTFNTFDNNSVIYGGKPLQPGLTYDWAIFKASREPEIVTFQVMPEEERNAIATELTQMETELKRWGVSDEAIALRKANYFAKHQLWSDVLQSAYTVQNPSADLTQFRKETIPKKFCP